MGTLTSQGAGQDVLSSPWGFALGVVAAAAILLLVLVITSRRYRFSVRQNKFEMVLEPQSAAPHSGSVLPRPPDTGPDPMP